MIYPLTLREKVSYQVQKRLPDCDGKDVSIEFGQNLKLDLSKYDVGHIPIIYHGFYELGLTRKLSELAKNGGTMIDVGANYGYFSCLWAVQNSRNTVYAFEASPLNVEPLRNNIGKNGLSDRIKIMPTALGEEKGKLNFGLEIETNQTGWGGFTLDDNSESVEVEVETLDNYALENEIDQIEVLKIDTEGADTWVLYGAKELLEGKRIKHIFFEHNVPRMELLKVKTNQAKDYLEGLGYIVESHSSTDFYAYRKT